MKFRSSHIKWIKSVTREKGSAWAYLNLDLGDTFYLNFSKNKKWFPTNYRRPNPKEIIALYQTLKSTDSFSGGTFLTHLVTPVDDEIIIENNGSHPYGRLMTVIAINSNPIPINSLVWSFFKCNRGQICDVKNIENKKIPNLSIELKQKFIWNLFDNIHKDLLKDIPDLSNRPDEIEDLEAIEGKEKTMMKLHKYRERDITLIRKAKKKAKQEGRLFCEVCLFNFEQQYPRLGIDFIECHHKQPISVGGIRTTKYEDLAIVCSNCHRMLHRKTFEGNYPTVDELRSIIYKKMN